ncbi:MULTISPECIES: hypothetical protein [unclassified Variovorax]|nr:MULTISPECIES: hypothetical protein [unclassified Variovorax]
MPGALRCIKARRQALRDAGLPSSQANDADASLKNLRPRSP